MEETSSLPSRKGSFHTALGLQAHTEEDGRGGFIMLLSEHARKTKHLQNTPIHGTLAKINARLTSRSEAKKPQVTGTGKERH